MLEFAAATAAIGSARQAVSSTAKRNSVFAAAERRRQAARPMTAAAPVRHKRSVAGGVVIAIQVGR